MTNDVAGSCKISSLNNHAAFDPVQLETECVHRVYDAIAEEFSSTRHSPWPAVMTFLRDQPPGAFGADVGCGNGKYLLAVAQSADTDHQCQLAPMLAMDRSFRLAEIVRQRGFDVIVGDILQLPYCSGRLDFFICIAVLHHLSTDARRLEAVRELARLLRPGGRGLIQVWAKEQRDPCSQTAAKYIRHPNRAASGINADPVLLRPVPCVEIPVHVSGTEFAAADMLVPWKQKPQKKKKENRKKETLLDDSTDHAEIGKTVAPSSSSQNRYYHLFVRGELDTLIAQIPEFAVERIFYEQGNWAAQVVKQTLGDCQNTSDLNL